MDTFVFPHSVGAAWMFEKAWSSVGPIEGARLLPVGALDDELGARVAPVGAEDTPVGALDGAGLESLGGLVGRVVGAVVTSVGPGVALVGSGVEPVGVMVGR